jgi:hypothetical protein
MAAIKRTANGYTNATAKPQDSGAGYPDDRAQQRQRQRDEEQKDDVTDHARHHPEEEQRDREPGQLDPARDLDLAKTCG